MFDGAIVAARLLQFCCALVLLGSPLFYLYGFEAGTISKCSRRWGWRQVVLLVAAAGALFGSLWWVAAQATVIFGAFDWASVQILLTETRFGRVTLLRIGLLVLSLIGVLLLSPGKTLWIVQLLLGGAIVASFAWTGHGALNDGWAGVAHLGGDVLHLLAAGAWIGALVGLSIILISSTKTQNEAGARAATYGLMAFSRIGLAVVSVLILTGLVNSWFLVGPTRIFDLFRTGYGLLLVAKLCLFAAMLGLAAVNRFRLTPRFNAALQHGGSAVASLKMLKRSVLTETVLAALVILAVSWMGTLEPPVSGG